MTDDTIHTCSYSCERPGCIRAQRDELVSRLEALTAAQRPAGDGCHCATCTCDPNMTPAVRFDLSPAQQEGAIREHLIRLGWTPPDERAMSQQPEARGVVDEGSRSVTRQLLHWGGVPVHVTGTVTTSPGNWSLIDAALADQPQGDKR